MPTNSDKMAEEHAEQQETAALNDCESGSDEVREEHREQESANFSPGFCGEGKDLDDEKDESEDIVMFMSI